MFNKINRRAAMSALVAAGMFAAGAAPAAAADMTFTLATSGTETDMRSVAMAEVFAPVSYTHLTLPTTPYV